MNVNVAMIVMGLREIDDMYGEGRRLDLGKGEGDRAKGKGIKDSRGSWMNRNEYGNDSNGHKRKKGYL